MKWITANNLDNWADTLPARVVFPEMIGHLVRACASDMTSFRFPNCDKGQVGVSVQATQVDSSK
jgi:hypothetical protein